MSSPASPGAHHLDSQIKEAHQKQSGLDANLRALDDELDALGAQTEQYAALDQACGSLEQLNELGIAELFWGEQTAAVDVDERIRAARRRVDAFHDSIEDVKTRRQALQDELKQGQDVIDILEDELYEEQLREEERKREWAVERDIDPAVQRAQMLPWMRGGEDDQRFRKSLAAAALVSLLLGILMPMIDLPIPEREQLIEVPERLARLIRQEQLPLPPPVEEFIPEEPVQEPEAEAEPEPDPQPEEEPVPVLADESQPDAPPAPVAVPEQEAAPEADVRATGILAFRESFSNLASSGPAAQLGSEARIRTAGEAAVGRTERSMVTTDGPGSSGGINLADLSRDVGGGGGGAGDDLAGVQATRVASSIGGGGTGDRPLAGGGSAAAGRTDEEIQIVFDRYKASLYRLYNRELRNDPTLRGQVVLRLTIEPDGSVSLCEMQASDMNAPALVEQVVERVKTFDFGAKDNIPSITISYPIDFLPAG